MNLGQAGDRIIRFQPVMANATKNRPCFSIGLKTMLRFKKVLLGILRMTVIFFLQNIFSRLVCLPFLTLSLGVSGGSFLDMFDMFCHVAAASKSGGMNGLARLRRS